MTTPIYKIRLRKGDFELEVQSNDRDWVETKFQELKKQETVVAKVEALEKRHIPETLGEFLDKKGNPQKHTDRVTVFAYWLFKVEKMELFNVKDIIDCYNKTRIPKPSNPNQIINQNVATHIFAETTEKKDGYKAWVITRTGEQYVEQMR
jgi:hypothetical protein